MIVFKKDDCEIYLLRLSSSEARNTLRSTRHWTGKHIQTVSCGNTLNKGLEERPG